MIRFDLYSILGASFLWLPACQPAPVLPPEGNPPLTGWKGAETHFAAQGKLDGEEIDLLLEGEAAADALQVFCEREYVVPAPGGVPNFAEGSLFEYKITAPFVVGDQERYVELELKQHDFQGEAAGAEITIVPRDDANPPVGNDMWLEWEWHLLADESDLFEQAAVEGTYTQGHFTGTPGPDGLVIPEGTGAAGGYIEAGWGGDESLKISTSAPCTANAVEQIE